MKYIRTKDGIFEYVDYDNECIIPMPIIKCKDKLTHCAEHHILKQANTIEELCDEFVIIRRDDNTFALAKYYPDDKTFYVKTADEEVSLSGCLMYGYEIYGAIWTDKGLIYVAKMNEKGELELL